MDSVHRRKSGFKRYRLASERCVEGNTIGSFSALFRATHSFTHHILAKYTCKRVEKAVVHPNDSSWNAIKHIIASSHPFRCTVIKDPSFFFSFTAPNEKKSCRSSRSRCRALSLFTTTARSERFFNRIRENPRLHFF